MARAQIIKFIKKFDQFHSHIRSMTQIIYNGNLCRSKPPLFENFVAHRHGGRPAKEAVHIKSRSICSVVNRFQFMLGESTVSQI